MADPGSPRPIIADKYKGFSDARPWADFLYVFRCATIAIANDQEKSKAELLKCLSDKLLLELRVTGFDVFARSGAELCAWLDKNYGAPKRTTEAAFVLLGTAECKPRQSSQDWAAEILTYAQEAKVTDVRSIVGHYLRGLPPAVSFVLSAHADLSSKSVADVVAVTQNVLEKWNQQQDHQSGAASSATVSVIQGRDSRRPSSPRGHSSGGQRSPSPKHGRNAARKGRGNRNSPGQLDPGPKITGKCKYCAKVGHMAEYCFSRIRDEEERHPDAPRGAFAIGRSLLSTTATINGTTHELLLDTCANDSFMCAASVKDSDGPLLPSSLNPVTANGSRLAILGCLLVNVHIGDCIQQVVMYVTPDLVHTALLGLRDMSKFGMVLDTVKRSVRLSSGTSVVASVSSRALSFGDVTERSFRSNDPPAVSSPSPSTPSVLPQSPMPTVTVATSNVALSSGTVSSPTNQPSKAVVPTPVVEPVAVSLAKLDYNTEVPCPRTPFIVKCQELAKSQHPALWSSDDNQIRLAKVKPMVINLKPGTTPVRIPVRPMSNLRDEKFASSQIDTWARQGVIVPSTSDWQTYGLVAYNGSKPRLCFNYIGLNRVSVFEPYEIPRLESIRRKVGTASVFSVLDMKLGFILCPLHPDSQDLTSFVDPQGRKWKFTRVCFGIMCSPTYFQEVMETVLMGLPGVHVYVDDILVFSDTVEQHGALLQSVLARLDSAHMLLNSAKCRTFMTSTVYLGNVISAAGLRPDPLRVKAVASLPFPATTSELKSFFGMAEIIRAFLPDYGLVKGYLLPLLKKDAAYTPTPGQRAAFHRLTEIIASPSLLYNPDMGKTLFLRTDWSTSGIGAVLYQLGAGGQVMVVQFLSRALSGAEKNYPAQKGEFLAVKWAVEVLEHWLIGHDDVVIITDHESLQHCMSETQQNATIRRWAATIKLVNARFEYRSGSSNIVADFLSRHPMLAETYGNVVVEDESGGDWSKVLQLDSSDGLPSPAMTMAISTTASAVASASQASPVWLNLDKLVRLQREDPDCAEVLHSGTKAAAIARAHRVLGFFTDPTSGVLLARLASGASARSVIFAPSAIVSDVIGHIHGNGHFRVQKTLKRVMSEFYWHRLVRDVKEHLSNCVDCAERDSTPKPSLPTGQLAAYRPNQLVASDVMGPLPVCGSGDKYIVTFTDHFTRFNISVAIPDATAEVIARAFVDRWIAYFGPPEHLLTDNGSNYTSTLFSEVCECLRVHRIYTTTYHPQGDGVAERFNRTLQNAISKFTADSSQWDRHLSLACAAHNATVSATTGVTPFEAMMGRDPPALIALPLGIDDIPSVESFARAAKKAQLSITKLIVRGVDRRAATIAAHNKRVPLTGLPKVGDIVLLHDPVIPRGPGGRKFFRPFTRRFTVVGVHFPNSLTIVPFPAQSGVASRRVHMNRVKLAPPALQPLKPVSIPTPTGTLPPTSTVDLGTPAAALDDQLEPPRASKSGRTLKVPSRFR